MGVSVGDLWRVPSPGSLNKMHEMRIHMGNAENWNLLAAVKL